MGVGNIATLLVLADERYLVCMICQFVRFMLFSIVLFYSLILFRNFLAQRHTFTYMKECVEYLLRVDMM